MATENPTLSSRQEVLAALPEHPAIQAIEAWKPGAIIDARLALDELTLTVAAADIRAACATVQAAGYNFFEDMTAVDWHPQTPRFQLSYHLLSHARRERLRLRVLLQESEASVDSIVPVWAGANFFEREVFDLFGIHFAGHPDLRRIMLPDDWQGHPLRKDYPVEGYR